MILQGRINDDSVCFPVSIMLGILTIASEKTNGERGLQPHNKSFVSSILRYGYFKWSMSQLNSALSIIAQHETEILFSIDKYNDRSLYPPGYPEEKMLDISDFYKIRKYYYEADRIKNKTDRTIFCYGESCYVYFKYSKELYESIKSLSLKKEYNTDEKLWIFESDLSSVRELKRFGEKYNFFFQESFIIHYEKLENKWKERLKKYSKIEPDSLNEIKNLPDGLKPFNYQLAGIETMIKWEDKAGINCDDMGLGKTIQSMLTFLELYNRGEVSNCLFIVPNSIKYQFFTEVKLWLPSFSSCIINNKWTDDTIKIINYEKLKKFKMQILENKFDIVFCDEFHTCNNEKALRSKMVWSIMNGAYEVMKFDKTIAGKMNMFGTIPSVFKKHFPDDVKIVNFEKNTWFTNCDKKIKYVSDRLIVFNGHKPKYRIGLTGTPISNYIVDLWSLLDCLGLAQKLFYSKKKFKKNICNSQIKSFERSDGKVITFEDDKGFNVDKARDVHEKLLKISFRRLKEQLDLGLKGKIRQRVFLDIDNESEYRFAEEKYYHYLLQKYGKEKGSRKVFSAKKAEKLTLVNELRKIVCKGKLQSAIKWINKFLDDNPDQKIIVFGWHNDFLMECFNSTVKHKPILLTGEETLPKVSKKEIDDFFGKGKKDDSKTKSYLQYLFQSKQEHRIFFANIKVGGVGLNLTASSNVAFFEFAWTSTGHDQAEDRAYRIGQKYLVNCYYLVARNTVDEKFIDIADSKRRLISSVIDGKEVEKTFDAEKEIYDFIEKDDCNENRTEQ